MPSDFSELDDLALDLTHAPLLAGAKIMAAVEDWAEDVEDAAKVLAPRTDLPHYADTITHDVILEGTTIVGEVGPDRDVNGQANLAWIFEYGTDLLPPRAHLGPADDRARPAALTCIDRVAGEIL